MPKADLRIDWATHKAAAFACRKWHYSGTMPRGKTVKVGAWESGRFIGAVVFGRGATPNLCRPYGVEQTEIAELCRVALTDHVSPVSRIVAIALRFLQRANPACRVVVSFADVYQGHHGGIYQAGNWIYTGQTAATNFFRIHGQIVHKRTLGKRFNGDAGMPQTLASARKIDPNAEVVRVPGKYRYVMPLDDEMRRKVLPWSKPYPKREKRAMAGSPGTATVRRRSSRSNIPRGE